MANLPSPARSSRVHWLALIAGIVTLLLGPVCFVVGVQVNGSIYLATEYKSGFIPLFAFGFVYSLVILVAFGLGLFGLVQSRGAAEPRKATAVSILALFLTFPGLCCLLVIWAFAVLPCSYLGGC